MEKSRAVQIKEQLEPMDESRLLLFLFYKFRHLMRPSDVTKFLKAMALGGAVGLAAATVLLLPYIQTMLAMGDMGASAGDVVGRAQNVLNAVQGKEALNLDTAKMWGRMKGMKVGLDKILDTDLRSLLEPVPDSFKRALSMGALQKGAAMGAILSGIAQVLRMAFRLLAGPRQRREVAHVMKTL